MKTYHVLFNPMADNGKCAESVKNLDTVINDGKISYVNLLNLGSYYDFFSSIPTDDAIVIIGGDGTLNRFLNDTNGLDIKQKILYYAGGSGNDFLHDIGKSKGDAPFDLSKYSTDLPTVEVKGKEYVFLNGVGVGLDGYVCHSVAKFKETSDKPVSYTAIALKNILFEYKPCGATITVDGVTKRFEKVWLSVTMNGRFCGGGMMIAPNQNRLNSEGLITVAVAHSLSVPRLISIFPKVFKGTQLSCVNNYTCISGQEIHVVLDRPYPFQIDGDVILDVKEYTARGRKLSKERRLAAGK